MGVVCASVSPHRGPVDPNTQRPSFWAVYGEQKSPSEWGINLNSCSTYSCILASGPGSDLSSEDTVKKAYVASFFWGGVKEHIPMELGERALRFDSHS